MKNLFWLIVLSLSVSGIIYGQNKNPVKRPIVNGSATELPKPEYSQEAKDFCASGKVEVEILISEDGNVIGAKAISGDELLHDSAIEAAKKAKFRQTPDIPPIKIEGIIIYNFVPEQKCLSAGIVNKKARVLPKPTVTNLNRPKHLQIKKEEIVVVQIVIDMSGDVTRARAILGHPMLRGACEISARRTKFAPILINVGFPIITRALLAYKFNPDGTIETAVEKDDKDIIGTPINLIKPSPAFCNCEFGKNPTVNVTAKIDAQGNVTEATAISGHPILKFVSRKAALESKFLPTNIKAQITIQYNFAETGKWSAEISSIQIKNIKVIQ